MTSTTMELAAKYADAVAEFALIELQLTDDIKPVEKARTALEQRIKELERDAKRYRWLRECDGIESVALNRYYETCEMVHCEYLEEIIDRAMSEAALTKAVEISQEYKLP